VVSDHVANRGPAYRVPRGGMDPATKRLALIAACLGGTLFVVLGAWSTLGGHSSRVVPVISAPAGPTRVKPANPGGLKVGHELILGSGLSDDGTDTLAPAPEAPDPQALKAPPVPKPSPLAAPAPVQPAALPPPVKPVAAAAPAHAAAPTAASSGHGTLVQLGALPTRQAAEEEWRRLGHRDATLLAGRKPDFSEATVNGQSWWRVRTGAFADEAQARAFCEKVHAAGGACSVVRL